ncbi:MAG: response regulator [Pyrinomonadaceae bacterium]
MSAQLKNSPIILVVEDVEETRDGIEALLKRDGYQVEAARDEEEAAECARRKPPNLMLVSLSDLTFDVLPAVVRRICEHADLEESVPVVIFRVEKSNEGEEVAVGRNVYLSRPDNFDQLRNFISRLLQGVSPLA